MTADLTRLLGEARQRLARLGPGQRRAIVYGLIVLGVAAGLLAAVGAYQPYGVLFTNMEPGEAQAAIEALRQAHVPHELADNGRTLRVPAQHIDAMRVQLAASGTVGQVSGGYELLDAIPFGASDLTIKLQQRRALEGELARTITSIRGVRQARVHLSVPEPSIFEPAARKPSASVVVAIEGGASLDRDEVRGIRNLVAHAVERLDASEVSIVDDRGRLLTDDMAGAAHAVEQQRDLERALEQRLVTLLTPIVGEGLVNVRVSVELDPTSMVETSKVFQPEQAAVRSEERQEDERRVGGDPAGLAGAQANNPGNAGGAVFGEGSVGTSAREITNYEVSFTERRSERTGGTIRRLSAAVVVAPLRIEDPPGSGTMVARERGPEEIERLRALAMTAIGFDAERGDKLQIDSMPFVEGAGSEASPAAWAPFVLSVVKLGGMALLALAIVVFALRPMLRSGRRALVEASPAVRVALADTAGAGEALKGASMSSFPVPSEEMHVRRERALEAALENSERAAEIVRAWLASDHEDERATAAVEREVAA